MVNREAAFDEAVRLLDMYYRPKDLARRMLRTF